MISSVVSKSVTTTPSDGTHGFVQPTPPTTPSSITQKSAGAEAVTNTQPPSDERIAEAVKQVNDAFTQKGQNLHVWIEKDDTTDINVVKLQDKNTKEVISQYPSKAIIAMADAISQSLDGKGQLIYVKA